ncbi:hypothetical protein SAMN05421630_101702 [Prauserella marina]|uniref:Uncharacterized protein n=1 Tax=Prauserella marina TaxID=530584 RepID=A0A1G6JFU3_9PSEU|nr:hypothetical protein [Prauserella marina]PWV84616.1 hypothetical protein DES30_101634 [Prauserella marina]SDC17614.1 hypothetical protein SAMN05421630_101702 [Prauserella marina]
MDGAAKTGFGRAQSFSTYALSTAATISSIAIVPQPNSAAKL